MAVVMSSVYEKKDALEKTVRRFSPGVGKFVQWLDKQVARMLSFSRIPNLTFKMTDASIRRISECTKDNVGVEKPFVAEYKAHSEDSTEYVFEAEVRNKDREIQINSSLYRTHPFEMASTYNSGKEIWEYDPYLDRILNTRDNGTELINAVKEGAGCGLIRFGTENLCALLNAGTDLLRFEDLIGETAEAGIAEIFDEGGTSLFPVLIPKNRLVTGSWVMGTESGSSVLCSIDPVINRLGRYGYYPLHGEGFITPVIESENDEEFAGYIAKLWAPPEEGAICERIPMKNGTFTEKKNVPEERENAV